MLSYGILYVGLTAVCLALVYMFHDSEQSAYRKIDERIDHCLGVLEIARKDFITVKLKADSLQNELEEVKKVAVSIGQRSVKACDDAAQAQIHCAKLRKSQIDIQEKLSMKQPLLKVEGPIQVEIYAPKKNLGQTKPKKAIK